MNDVTLRDQFEWDLGADERQSSPEAFSRALCADLGLCREFESVISHSIREQLGAYRKLARKGDYHPRPSITSAYRHPADVPNWTPAAGPSSKMAESFSLPSSKVKKRPVQM